MCYSYELSVGDSSVNEILLKAFHEGAVVILDELNLDSKKKNADQNLVPLEVLLNQLLTGKDMNGQKAKTLGFMVCASQNAGHEKARKPVSRALNNRMPVMYMEDYSDQALIQMAAAKEIVNPKGFVLAYNACRKKYPDTTTRTYFTALNKVSQVGMFRQDDVMGLGEQREAQQIKPFR